MKVFPVIHLGEPSMSTSIGQAHIAFEEGANGVYLIDHFNKARDTRDLYEALRLIRAEYPNGYVGLNILGLSVPDAFGRVAAALSSGELQEAPSDLWVDDVRRGEKSPVYLDEAFEYRKSLAELEGVTLHGGIAFKGTATATNNAISASNETVQLRRYVDTITTSGMGTGIPPTVEKIAHMKFVSGGKPIAVASGIDLENVGRFAQVVDEVLVASSVETYAGSGEFNRPMLRDFIQAAHNLIG